jgi:PIN domain nuclease of toxin-antitoxin system
LRLLLDTHTLIWWAERKPVSTEAAAALSDPQNDVFVSAASVWEAEIKVALGMLQIHFDPATDPLEHGFEALPITLAHAAAAGRLPAHHGDPFDRILVAQAQLEGLTLVTRDPVFDRYAVAVLRA